MVPGFFIDYKTLCERIESVGSDAYARSRNHLAGAVTCLGPFIADGVISTRQVAQSALARSDSQHAAKLLFKLGLHLSWCTIHPPLARICRDYEPGIHLSQLQRQAGVVGIINTIRVYSPVKQILDQDPECVFIKRWLPELAEFSALEIAASDRPWLGQCPDPIVDFKPASKAMKDQIFAIRKSAEGKIASAAVLAKHGLRKRPSRKKD